MSSITAALGNRGQADYGAANGIINGSPMRLAAAQWPRVMSSSTGGPGIRPAWCRTTVQAAVSEPRRAIDSDRGRRRRSPSTNLAPRIAPVVSRWIVTRRRCLAASKRRIRERWSSRVTPRVRHRHCWYVLRISRRARCPTVLGRTFSNRSTRSADAPPDWDAELFLDPTRARMIGCTASAAAFSDRSGGVRSDAIRHHAEFGRRHRAGSFSCSPRRLRSYGRCRLCDADLDRTGSEVIIGRGTYVNRGNTTAVQHGIIVDSVSACCSSFIPSTATKSSQRSGEVEEQPPALPRRHGSRARAEYHQRTHCQPARFHGSELHCRCRMRFLARGARSWHSRSADGPVRSGGRGRRACVHAASDHHDLLPAEGAFRSKGRFARSTSRADGTLLGEGVGMVALKRREDAERDGDRIYAIVKGMGIASDGRALGLLAPRLEGEELALRRAYEAAGVDPSTVGLIEAHGTAHACRRCRRNRGADAACSEQRSGERACALGSVKSMIGHTDAGGRHGRSDQDGAGPASQSASADAALRSARTRSSGSTPAGST